MSGIYDINKPIRIQVDTSRSGISAALIQDGKRVAYASKSLIPTQQRYAIKVFVCHRFYQYIYEKKVQVESIHKVLELIMKKTM